MRPPSTLACLGFLALAVYSLLGCELAWSQPHKPSQTRCDRTAMLTHLAHRIMLPTYLAFEAETMALQRATAELCEAPSADQLKKAQASWRRATELWRRSQAFQLDLTQTYAKSIGFWPTRLRRLRVALAGDEPITPDFVETMRVAAHGLLAMEQLLCDVKAGKTGVLHAIKAGPMAKRWCPYLLAMATHLTDQAKAVAQLWRPEGGDFIGKIAGAGQGNTTYPTSHQAISDIVNQLVTAVEESARKKIGKPLRGNGRKPWPNAVEAGRSGVSAALVIATLEGAFAIYSGEGAAQSGPGFDDFLTALGSDLGARISQQFHAALTAVRAISPPLRVAIVEQSERVRAAHEAVRQLFILLKVDMTNVLSVTVAFSDNDGD